MKKYLIIALLVGSTIPVVIAQQNNTKRHASEMKVDDYSQRRADLLKTQLQLSDAQVQQVKAVYAKNAPVRLGMQSQNGVNITEMNKKELQEVETLLTPAQKEQFKQQNMQMEINKKQKQIDRSVRSEMTIDEVRPDLKQDLQKNK